jgi:hypothetical protein
MPYDYLPSFLLEMVKSRKRRQYRKYCKYEIWETAKLVREQKIFTYEASNGMGVTWISLRDFLSKIPHQKTRLKQISQDWEDNLLSALVFK